LAAAFSASARERLRHPVDVFGGGVFLVLLLFIFTHVWSSIGPGARTAGWGLSQLVGYLLVTELVMMSTSAIHLRIASDVRSGQLAVELLRPVRYAHWELARALGVASVRVTSLFVAGLVAVALLVGLPRVDARGAALGLLVMVPVAIVIESSVRVLIGLLAFWFEDANAFYWIWQKGGFLLGGVLVPLHLYPAWLKAIARLTPFQALYFDPARTVVAYDGAAAAAALVRLLLWFLAIQALLLVVARRACRSVQLNGG
jgi:ABC-2 type transport system permease protein